MTRNLRSLPASMATYARTHAKTLAAVGLAAAVTGGAVAYAAGPAVTSVAAPTGGSAVLVAATSPSGSGSTAGGTTGAAGARSARRAAGLRRLAGHGLIGKVTSTSTTGGLRGAGTITITPPDGTAVTLELAPRTKVVLYHGPKVKPTAETLADLKTGEVVAIEVRRVQPTAAGTGNTGSTTTSTTNSSSTTGASAGTPVAVLILDTGFAAS
jgi:hypothetical protein